jgi:hypothetical protein
MTTYTNNLITLQQSISGRHRAETPDRPRRRDPLDLTEHQVLAWADAFYASHGHWPRWDSGPIPESNGETWFSVSAALVLGRRGFRPGESLAAFLFVRHRRARCIASERKLSVN